MFYHLAFSLLLIFNISIILPAQVQTLEIKKNTKKDKNVPDLSNQNELIHLGDLINVDIVGSTEFDWRGRLSNEGYLAGLRFTEDEVFGLCRTVSDVAAEIALDYGRFLNNPVVKVSILDRSQRLQATLSGAVKSPQKFELRRRVYLSELIVLAGGFTDNASGTIRIFRQPVASCKSLGASSIKVSNNNSKTLAKFSREINSNVITVTVADLLSGDTDSNVEIHYGDLITVSLAEPIFVIGGVANPTRIPMRAEMTASRAIASAGGLSKSADAEKITIFRREDGQTKVINTSFDKISEQLDIQLKAFDIIDVGEKGNSERKFPPIINFDEYEGVNIQNLPISIIE